MAQLVSRPSRTIRARLLGFVAVPLVLIGVASPANATSDPWRFQGDYATSLGMSVSGDLVAFCAADPQPGPNGAGLPRLIYEDRVMVTGGEAYVPDPLTHASPAAGLIPAGNTFAAAALLGVASKGDSIAETAAIHHALLSLSDGGAWQAPEPVVNRSRELIDQARAAAGPYTVEPSWDGETLVGVGVRSTQREWLAGYPLSINIEGPAVITEMPAVTTDQPLQIPVEFTGYGEVAATVTVTGLPPVTFTVLQHPVAQDYLVAGERSYATGVATLVREAPPEPEPEPTPEPEPVPTPTPEPEPEPSPVPEPTPEPTPEPEPSPEPEPEPSPEPTPDPEPSPEPEPSSQPEPASEPEPSPEPESRLPETGWFDTPLILLAGSFVVLGGLAVYGSRRLVS